MPILDQYRRDTRPEWVQDYHAALAEKARAEALARVMAAVKAAQAVVDAEHRRNDLNLCDVQSYLEYAADAVQSEAENE